MKRAEFKAYCPVVIGDKVKIIKKPMYVKVAGNMEKTQQFTELRMAAVETHVITDIAATHFVRSGEVEFSYELDNSGVYQKMKF